MPVKSAKQMRLMQAVAHGSKNSPKGIGGLDKETAKKFIKKTPKEKRTLFSKGKD